MTIRGWTCMHVLRQITLHRTFLIVSFAAVTITGCATSTHRETGIDGGYRREGGSGSRDAEASDRETSDGDTDTESVDRDATNNDRDGRDVTIEDNDAESSATCKSEIFDFAEVRVFERGRGELGGIGPREMHASIKGVVTELGEGFIPSDVTTPSWPWQTEAADVHWIRIVANEDVEWVVLGKRLPYGFSVAKGSAISIQYAYVFGGWSSSRTALWIYAGDTLAFYFGEAGQPSELELPHEIVVSRGEILCEVHGDCGDYELYALDVKLFGASVTLDTGQSTTAGDYELWHRRTAYETSSTTQCMDWYVADTAITIARRNTLRVTAETACRGATYSTQPDLRLEIEDSDCKFTLAEVEQGISFNYRVVIDSDITGVIPVSQDAGGCQAPHKSGLYLGERIFGGDQSYCICDAGLCAPINQGPYTLKSGTYPGTFAWEGHNWNGPSDTNNPQGPLFPAGSYTFELSTSGTDVMGGFEAWARLAFELE